MSDRLAAAVALIGGIALFALGVMLGSISNGNGAPTVLLQAVGTIAEVSVLAALLYAFAKIGQSPWAQVGRGLAIVAVGLLMTGDAVSAEAAREVGNAMLYLTLTVLGLLLWDVHVKLGAFAVVNGALGFIFLAWLEPMGVPPLNLMLIVVWLLALAFDWLRAPWPTGVVGAEVRQPAQG